MFGTLGHGLNHRFIKVLEASALPHCKQPYGLVLHWGPGNGVIYCCGRYSTSAGTDLS